MPAVKQTSTDARVASLEAKRISLEGDAKEKVGEASREPAWGRNRGIPAVTYQALGVKCKEPSLTLWSSIGETNMSCVDNDYKCAICASV